MRRSESEQRFLEKFQGKPSGVSLRRGEQEHKKTAAASIKSRKMLRPDPHRSVVASTVEGGLDGRERREKHTETRGENNSLTSNEANACVIYAIRRQVFYCRTIENES
jgi:hypothetical protein